MGKELHHIRVKKVERDAVPPRELLRMIWETVESSMRRHLKRKVYDRLLDDYLREVAHDGLDDGAWEVTDTDLWLSFPTYGGLRSLYAVAANHWTELACHHSLMSQDQQPRAGWRVEKPSGSRTQILRTGVRYPLVELGRHLYAVQKREPGQHWPDPPVWSDEDVPPRERSRLTPRMRKLVDRAAVSGQCLCQFCERLRTADLKRDEQRVLDRYGDPDLAEAAWDLLEADPTARQLADAAYQSISSWQPLDWTFVQVDDPLDELLLYLERRAVRPPADLLTCMLYNRATPR